MATDEQPPNPVAVDAVRMQLRSLAQAADLTVPELRVDAPRQVERLPAVAGDGAVVVPRGLLAAGRAKQLWHLAACLGRISSPVPRRRQRLGWLLFALFGLAYVVLLVVAASQFTVIWLAIALLYPLGSWTARWERRAMEDEGRRILTAAGHDPAAIAREAFGDEPEPPFFKQLISNEPTPAQRIAAASHP